MPKIRVLIVDDAVVMRRLITETLSRDPDIEVAGVAANGKIALAKIPQVNPDIVTLDVEMPEMDGIATLRELRKLYPSLPVIMFSTLTERGAGTTLDALAAGASDYVTKPANVGSVMESLGRLEADLVPRIKSLCGIRVKGVATHPPIPTSFGQHSGTTAPTLRQRTPIDAVCIGTSTGGPNALAEVFKAFPTSFPVPILIVQHMPPVFTQMLAERLNNLKTLRFHEGAEGMKVEPGHVYIAPGGKHMEVQRNAAGLSALHLHEGTPENSCRPAVDVLFRSVARIYGGRTLAVILTGMGQDGLRGCEFLREAGARIIAQDQPTSIVWGMPGYVANKGLADHVLPISQVAPEIIRQVQDSRRALSSAPAQPATS